jgi:hypothetical protein
MSAHTFLYTVFILIHGTWGSDGIWYQPGGDFCNALTLSASANQAAVVPFRWSGNNTDKARKEAAYTLMQLIRSYPAPVRLCIIAHSHGGNVALLASQLFAIDYAMHKRIDAVYLLGTPANRREYKPDMRVINNVYNIISFEDMVQPVVGFFEREQPLHERIANIRITIDGKEPDHAELHNTIVGKWFIYLDQCLHTEERGNFVHFLFDKPGVIHFHTDREPIYEIDTDWSKRIERDKNFNKLLLNAMSRTMKKGDKNRSYCL